MALMSVASIACLMPLAFSAVCLAADRPLNLEEIGESVDPQGRVVNRQLARQTGWRTLHAFAWTMELEDPRTGAFTPVDPKRDFRHGQRFRLRIETATDLHVYVLVHNADGSDAVLLPEKAEQVPLVSPGKAVYLPSSGAFRFGPPAGQETLRLLASPQPLPWVTAPELFQVKHGDTLSREQQDALAQLRSVRTRSIDGAFRRQRDVEIVAADAAQEATLVRCGTALGDARPTLVHEIALRHVE